MKKLKNVTFFFSKIKKISIRHSWIKKAIVFLLFMVLWLNLANYSSKLNDKDVFHYQSEMFADRAGYYIYLPAAFIYGFRADNYPDQIDIHMGNGFHLDTLNNKVRTKYTCGVAILASPFFLATHAYQKMNGHPSNAFTKPYFRIANYTSTFYLLLGMFFLFCYLKKNFKWKYVLISILLAFFATNLFYYAIIDTFMSHVYSFSMMSIFLWGFDKYLSSEKKKFLFLISFLAGIIILIRPINVLFLWLPLLVNVSSSNELKSRVLLFLKPLPLIIMFSVICLIFLPQLMYYKFISGHFFYYSYTNEGFTNILSPKILEVLFSPMNGLFLYTPFYFIFIISSLFLIFKKNINGFIGLFVFLLMLFISATWWCWSWGCGYSIRPFVDVLPLLLLSLVPIVQYFIKKTSKTFVFISFIFIFYFSYSNVVFSLHYSRCFMGSEWDWKEYNDMMSLNNVFPYNTKMYSAIFNPVKANPIKIRTSDGGYLNSADGGKIIVNYKNHENTSNSDCFSLISIEESVCALIDFNGNYVCSDLHLNGMLIASRSQIGFWEKFILQPMNDEKVTIKNSEGLYLVSDTLNQIIGQCSSIDSALKFEFIISIPNLNRTSD